MMLLIAVIHMTHFAGGHTSAHYNNNTNILLFPQLNVESCTIKDRFSALICFIGRGKLSLSLRPLALVQNYDASPWSSDWSEYHVSAVWLGIVIIQFVFTEPGVFYFCYEIRLVFSTRKQEDRKISELSIVYTPPAVVLLYTTLLVKSDSEDTKH